MDKQYLSMMMSGCGFNDNPPAIGCRQTQLKVNKEMAMRPAITAKVLSGQPCPAL